MHGDGRRAPRAQQAEGDPGGRRPESDLEPGDADQPLAQAPDAVGRAPGDGFQQVGVREHEQQAKHDQYEGRQRVVEPAGAAGKPCPAARLASVVGERDQSGADGLRREGDALEDVGPFARERHREGDQQPAATGDEQRRAAPQRLRGEEDQQGRQDPTVAAQPRLRRAEPQQERRQHEEERHAGEALAAVDRKVGDRDERGDRQHLVPARAAWLSLVTRLRTRLGSAHHAAGSTPRRPCRSPPSHPATVRRPA
jgi:hypothetical protein